MSTALDRDVVLKRGKTEARHTHDHIIVTCDPCGWLGAFHVTASQPYEGALKRAERLVTGHVCKA